MKQKTNKSASKRFKLSARGKVKHRPVHQAHFNAKDDGNETRRKHETHFVKVPDKGRIKKLLPYS
jgi:large subunit ribosomal protein L35